MERNSIDVNEKRKASGAAVIQVSLTLALYRALFEEWSRTGYNGIRLDSVAARASAGKAAIYRRWSSKKEFAAEAITQTGMLLAINEDCGSLEKDILAFLLKMRAMLRHPLIRKILPDLHAELARNGDLSEILAQLAEKRRKIGEAIFVRGIGRGELHADIDMEYALSLLPSTLYWQMVVLNKRISHRELERQARIMTGILRSEQCHCDGKSISA